MTAESILFWLFAIPLVATALGVVLARSPVYAAMNLVAAFFFMAGIYILLTAHLIAFMQILVYAGAVMVLFLFVIMLISLGDEHLLPARHTAMQWLGGFGALAMLGLLIGAFYKATDVTGPMRDVAVSFGTVKAVGAVLFTDYLLPFEATSLLLLVAIVGAVVIAKERI
jgi:NADH-quinone oxidoreductase subunit J